MRLDYARQTHGTPMGKAYCGDAKGRTKSTHYLANKSERMTVILPTITFILGLALGYSIAPIKAYLVKIHDKYIERQWKKKEEHKRNLGSELYFRNRKLQNEIWLKEKEQGKSN